MWTHAHQHYLLKFGYLPQSGFEIRDQISERRMEEGIRELQAFANLIVTGVIDEATRRLIQRPRCGVPDILSGQFMSESQEEQFGRRPDGRRRQKRFIIQGQKWPTTSLTWSVKRASPAHDENDIVAELSRAIAVWSRSTPLRFSRLTPDRADDADIRIVFSKGYHEDGYPFDGKGSILAHAFFPGAGQGGDAHFDDDEIWIINGKSQAGEGTRLFAVAAHEFGHSLGLSHSDVEGALMYPWYQNFDYDLRLTKDDELGIQRIYGSTPMWAPNPYAPNYNPSDTDHETPRPRVTTPTRRGKPYHPFDGRPNTCDSSYDAISLIRDELFIFKGRHFWRVNSKPNAPNDNRLLKGYPSLITNMWQQLPPNLTHVDAVYEHDEVEIVFFIGRYYWRFRGTNLQAGYPKPLTSMGISPDVEKIDGAMIWGHNKKTYLFSGTQYWRLQDVNPHVFHIEPDYPRNMFVWQGVPTNIDSVLRWKDGHTYFFKGKVFWKFNDKHMRVDSDATLSAPFWMGCTSTPLVPTEKNPHGEDDETSSAAGVSSPIMTVIVVSLLTWFSRGVGDIFGQKLLAL
ncbi:matrix metalloproteinase-2 isoform X2 [Folsomia candida]|uniref:matrix metalloproteinase-2 isoform X2 n=1 Tax=Folsomia candida TaxID=158441 RepID=UPI001604E959|nr:matrix metalloproteinase-2 isoform X2 [Folsomia candida]